MNSLFKIPLLFQLFFFSWTSEVEKTYKNSITNCAIVAESGIYDLSIPGRNETFQVICDQEINDGGWTLVLERFKGKLDFHNRDWEEYKNGFDNYDGEYFIGLEKLHLLTTTRTHSLLILMRDFDDIDYSTFAVEFEIGDEDTAYAFSVVKSFHGTEIGLPEYDARFCSMDIPKCWEQLIGWQWGGLSSRVTNNRLNMFGPYLKIGDSIKPITMGFYNEETEMVHPLRSIKMLIRPVNMYRSSYNESFSKLY